jgi:hypothetical protein
VVSSCSSGLLLCGIMLGFLKGVHSWEIERQEGLVAL